MKAKELARRAAVAAFLKKAEDVSILDLSSLSSITDFFVLCTGNSDVHVRAIHDAILEDLEKDAIRAWHAEGYTHGRWIVMDFVDVVVHIFLPEVREYYGLERLWGDAETEYITEEQMVHEHSKS